MLPRNSFVLLFGVVLLVTIAAIQAQPDEPATVGPSGPKPTRRPTPRPTKTRRPTPKTRRTTKKPTRIERAAKRPTPLPCPKKPRKCPAAGKSLCVRSRKSKLCRRVANNCELRNLNCQPKPRNKWLVVKPKRCLSLKIGGPAVKCQD